MSSKKVEKFQDFLNSKLVNLWFTALSLRCIVIDFWCIYDLPSFALLDVGILVNIKKINYYD